MAHKVICINRRCGSGGHIIGEMVAKELGIKYYDKTYWNLLWNMVVLIRQRHLKMQMRKQPIPLSIGCNMMEMIR